MKGIRSLFLGLIFMTLIGVGFKIDVKADDALKMEKKQPSSWEWDSSSTDPEPEIVWKLSFSEGAYLPFSSSAAVNVGDYTQITYSFGEDDLFNERKLILKRTKAADADKFSAELIIVQDDGTDSSPTQITVSSDGSGSVEKLFSLSKSEIETQFANQTASERTKTWGSDIYAGAQLAGYKSNGYRDNSIFSVTSDISINCPNVYLRSYQVDAKAYDVSGNPLSATIDGDGKWYIFGDTADAKITTPPTGYEFIKWTAGDNSTINSTMVVANEDKSISFIVDEPETRKAWFGKKHSITVSSDPSAGGAVAVDKSSALYDEKVTLTSTPSSGYAFKEWNIVKPSGLTITDNSFSMPDDDVEIKAVFEKIKQSTLKVTLGKTINLGKFISETITSIENDGPYIGISQSGVSTSATSYTIKGKRITPSSGVSDQITINGNSVPVIVYDKPSINAGSGTLTINIPDQVWHDNISYNYVDAARVKFEGGGTTKYKTYSNGETFKWDKLSNLVKNDLGFSSDSVTMTIYPINPEGSNDDDYDKDLYDEIKLYKVELNGDEGANYSINDTGVGDSYTFYAIGSDEVSYKISATPKTGYLSTIEKWEGVSFGTSTSGNASFSDSKTIKAYFKTTSSSAKPASSSSPSSTGRTTAAGGSSGSGMDDYDDVPKTGESKADIWILWSVLFISILGAGFMIWKRFGLVKAIAEADEEVAYAEHEEMAEAKKQEKESKLKMLMDLRNLK